MSASIVDLIATHNKVLETQISQVAQQQASSSAHVEIFFGQPVQNPKGHLHDVNLRSGEESGDASEKNN